MVQCYLWVQWVLEVQCYLWVQLALVVLADLVVQCYLWAQLDLAVLRYQLDLAVLVGLWLQ